jgi:hypothetical protein
MYVTNNRKKKYGKEYKIDWAAVAPLAPSLTKVQCRHSRVLDAKINQTPRQTCRWTADEDIKLKDSVQTHGGKHWDGIAALVPDQIEFVSSWMA